MCARDVAFVSEVLSLLLLFFEFEVELVGLARRRRVVDGGVGDVAVPVYHRVEQRMQRGSISVVGGIPLRKVSGEEREEQGQVTALRITRSRIA